PGVVTHSDFVLLYATTTTDIYTTSLHDALPICLKKLISGRLVGDISAFQISHYTLAGLHQPIPFKTVKQNMPQVTPLGGFQDFRDRKSTRLNSSHVKISYAVFCLKKKNNMKITT